MNSSLIKVYAAFLSGCMGENILEAYFPFLAKIIYEEKWYEVDDDLVAEKFYQKYNFKVPTTFIRQVLAVGINRKAIVHNRGIYQVDRDKMQEFQFDSSSFDKKWKKTEDSFRVPKNPICRAFTQYICYYRNISYYRTSCSISL
jgi:hypothetical protein